LVPLVHGLDVDRPNDLDPLIEKTLDQMAADKTACPANRHFLIFQAHETVLLFYLELLFCERDLEECALHP
jgi:hypothetical protein